MDESTNIASLPELSVFICFINNAAVLEDLLFCKVLNLHTKGENIFFTEYSISWDKYACICTDGAAACTSIKSGVENESKPKHQMLNKVFSTEVLAAKKLLEELHKILSFIAKYENLIKARLLNQQVFSSLCTDMGADLKTLLLHMEV